MRLLLLSFCICLTCYLEAQVYVINPDFRYADFHAHTTLKNFYRAVSNNEKVILRKDIDLKNTNWLKRDRSTGIGGKLKTAGASAINGSIKSSYNQTSFDLLKQGNGSFIYTSLYALEKQQLSKYKVTLKMPVVSKTVFYLLTPVSAFATPFTWLSKNTKVLRNTYWDYWASNQIKIRNINNLAVTKLSPSKQSKMMQKNFPSYTVVQEEIRFLELNTNPGLIIVKDAGQLDSLIILRNAGIKIPTLIFLTFEGGHNFYGTHNSYVDSVKSEYCDDDSCKQEIFNNIRITKNGNYRIFMVGLAHLFYNKLAGASRGLDVDRPKLFRKVLNKSIWESNFSRIDGKPEEGFYTKIRKKNTTSVITPAEDINGRVSICGYTGSFLGGENPGFGTRIIDTILDNQNKFGKRTFIDMRHMDVLARHQLIEHYEKKYWSRQDTIPLVVSHAAYSGENYRIASATGLCPYFDIYEEFYDYKNYLHKLITNDPNGANKILLGIQNEQELNAHIDSTGWFHPMSNNLYTEEIAAIYKSKGMIGITFEERALGSTSYNYEENDATKHALKNFLKANKNKYDFSSGKRDSLINAEPFLRNIFAVIKHSGLQTGDINTWKHICIGTDFDGIMNPIDICPTAKDIPAFYGFLCRNLDFYIDYLEAGNKVKCGKSSQELMNMFFYENLENFTVKHF